jgi:hypothetical protein
MKSYAYATFLILAAAWVLALTPIVVDVANERMDGLGKKECEAKGGVKLPRSGTCIKKDAVIQ